MGFIQLLFAGGSADNWFALTISPYSGSDALNNAFSTVDASGNVFVGGYVSPSIGVFQGYLFKLNPQGTIQWARRLDGPSTNDIIIVNGLVTDSSGALYICGRLQQSTSVSAILLKFDTNGSIAWQRLLSSGQEFKDIDIDSSANVYTASTVTGTGSDPLLTKWNSSGTIQYQRRLGGAGANDLGYGVGASPAGVAYIVGSQNTSTAGGVDAYIARYDATPTLSWQRRIGGTSNDVAYLVKVGSDGSAYAAGGFVTAADSLRNAWLFKYNSSGVLQWQRLILDISGYSGLAIDSSDNIFVGTHKDDTILIARYSSSGTLQWQRSISGTNIRLQFPSVSIFDQDNIVVSVPYSETSLSQRKTAFTARLPKDGSKTGTYGALTYAVSNFTETAGSATEGASSFTNNTAAFTSSTSSFTAPSLTFTQSITRF